MSFGTSVILDLPFDAALTATREALAGQGFGIITEIDMQATMRTKLGEEYPPLIILGACNPRFAHEAMSVDPSVATLLPCNVVVRQLPDDRGVEVASVDPKVLVDATGTVELEPLAHELTELLAGAFAALT